MVESKKLSERPIMSYLYAELHAANKYIFYELLKCSHSIDIKKNRYALFFLEPGLDSMSPCERNSRNKINGKNMK